MTFVISKTPRWVAVTTTALAAVSVLAACGQATTTTGKSSDSTAPSSQTVASVPGPHNAQDVKFAQMMIPHHKQAIAMAEVVLAKSASSDVKELAKNIKQAQAPENRKMRQWLAAWDAPTTPGRSMHHGKGMHGKGMMSPEQMAKFKQADGAALNRMFLEMMIQHHQGAVAMARTELHEGKNPQAKQLAKSIIETQKAEIEQMRRMLDE